MQPEENIPTLALGAEDFLALCGELLGQESMVRVEVEGISMTPYLLPGDILWIEPAAASEVRVGEVALYRRQGRPIIHQLAGRTRRRGRWLMVFRSVGYNLLEPPLEGEAVMGRVTGLERDGSKRSAPEWPLGLWERLRARWRLLMHGRVAEDSWLRRAPGRAVQAAQQLLLPLLAAQASLRDTPGIGVLIRRLVPPLGERLRIARVVNRRGKRGESYLVEAYLGKRKVGYLTLRQPGSDTWWLGVQVRALYRRRGVGKRLVQEIGAWAEELGIGPLCAAIQEDNLASLALFQAAGYVRSEDRELEQRVSQHFRDRAGRPLPMVVYTARTGPASQLSPRD